MFGLDWMEVSIRVFFAVIIGGAVGIEREYKNRPAGMRTHVLVCLGSAMIALVECLMRQEMMNNAHMDNVAMSVGRLSAQVVSGIGFLGAGTIFIAQKKITGLTTAASLWNTACLGLMTGFGFYWIALGCCAIVLLVLNILQRIIHVNAIKRVEVKFIYRNETMNYINSYFEQKNIKTLDVDFHIESKEDSPESGHNIYTNLYTLHLPNKVSYTEIVNFLAENPHILAVRTRNT